MGPNMAKRGASLSHVSRHWLRELILSVRCVARFFIPDLMVVLNKLNEDEASFATWLDQLRQLEWHFNLEDMPDQQHTSAEFPSHCSVANRWITGQGLLKGDLSEITGPVCSGSYDEGGLIADDVSDNIGMKVS